MPGLVATFLIAGLRLERVPAGPVPVQRRRPDDALTVAAQNATRGPQWYMSVLIQIMIIPVIALAVALERVISRGLLVGAVKG